jgi:hypothetical protein
MCSFRTVASLAAILWLTTNVQCAEKENEAVAEIELGTAGEWGLPHDFGIGPSLGIEYTVVRNWLEIEAEVSPTFGNGLTEWGSELVFKKPFSLSDNAEMMVGLGPEWLHRIDHGETTDSVGGVILADFQIWPSPERKYGWFIEPSYGYDFGRGHEQSLGITAGLIIPVH